MERVRGGERKGIQGRNERRKRRIRGKNRRGKGEKIEEIRGEKMELEIAKKTEIR